MFQLQTERLKIFPLNIEQLEMLRKDKEVFEKSLSLKISEDEKFDDTLEKEIENAWEFWIKGVKKNPLNYIWFTRWEIILKDENKIIGSMGFKGMPNYNGEVEVGYMIKPKYQSKRFMTEALKEFVRFTFMHQRVKCILAETPIENYPSQKVLEKNKFVKFEEKDNNFWWKLERKPEV